MKLFEGKLHLSRLTSIALIILLAGCAANAPFRHLKDDNTLGADVLHRYLDRWVGWQSLTAQVKLKVINRDTTATARGHLMYLMGERYELGFARPYNQFLGNLYVTPEKTVYWDVGATPKVFSAGDTSRLSEIIHMGVPNWDPRDLFPFPLSGRNSGVQADSTWREGEHLMISVSASGATHVLTVSRASGLVEREWISRTGRDPVLKLFRKTRMINDWPVPVQVTCTDSASQFSVTWSLGGVSLKSEPYSLPPDSLAPRISG